MKRTIYTCFPGGKHKVLTMSYDDGQIHDRRLIEIFNKYGIKGTFHLNSGLMGVREDGMDDPDKPCGIELSDEQLREAGVAPDLIRLSVGIENVEDIIADLEQAMKNIE